MQKSTDSGCKMQELSYDLVVVGAGAGGISTALAASRMGVRTLVLEQEQEIGGTGVVAGVSCWEPSVGGSGIPLEIYERLSAIPNAVGVYSFKHHHCWAKSEYPVFPGGMAVIDPRMGYSDTLRRHGSIGIVRDEAFVRKNWHGVQTEPTVLASVARNMLGETANCDIRTNVTVTQVDHADGSVGSLSFEQGERQYAVRARFFADCTADSVICSQAGCEMMFGTEGQAVFGEPDAPAESSTSTNAASLIFRITRNASRWVAGPVDVPEGCWWRHSFPFCQVVEYPNGDWNVNMLPTMEGDDFRAMPYEDAYSECVRRVHSYWRYLKSAWPDFGDYEIGWIAPRIGVREGPRCVGEHVLTELDLLAGVQRQGHADIIAVTDHMVDVHGSRPDSDGSQTEISRRQGEVERPYGVPFRCLLPRGYSNLVVASRGASFSHIAAASCRLTRTIMRLGQAAGTAVGVAIGSECLPRDIAGSVLRSELRRQGVTDLPD